MIRLLLLLAAALAYSGPATAQLALSLQPTVATPVLGEPVAVVVTLSSRSLRPQEVTRRLKPEFGAVEFFITPPGGERQRFVPFALKEPVRPTTVIAAGGAISESADLYFDGRAWVFTRPGTYVVDALYEGTVAAQPVRITIRAPETEAERTASQLLLRSAEAGLYLLVQGGENLERGRAVVERVAEIAPQTPHATHANLALGVAQARAAPDFRSLRLRPADPAAAVSRLEKVNVERLSPEDIARTQLTLARSYRALGRLQDAIRTERRLEGMLERRFPALGPSIRQQLMQDVRSRR